MGKNNYPPTAIFVGSVVIFHYLLHRSTMPGMRTVTVHVISAAIPNVRFHISYDKEVGATFPLWPAMVSPPQ